jgi:deoxycytidylate deaminase
MMRKNEKILDGLFDLACDLKDTNRHPYRTQLVSAIYIKGRPIAWGFNQMKSHPFQALHAKNDHAIYWHSETQCIHNALKRVSVDDLKAATMYVARRKLGDGQETYGMAHPCIGCMNAIIKYGIRRVVYTLDDSGYAEIKVKQ